MLPVWHDGQFRLMPWGNRDRRHEKLPPTGWTWRASVDAGKWAEHKPEMVDIPAAFGFMNGVWYLVKEGMRGLLVRDSAGAPSVYMMCEPSTRYYRVMTRAKWMPTLIREVI